MTVAELIDKLSDYGDHLEVVIIAPDEEQHDVTNVGSSSTPDGVVVELIY